VAIILSIAARPCTGAVFLLLLTWRLDVLGAGVAGTFAMGLGTASVTLCVALLAAGVRGGLLMRVLSAGGNRGSQMAAALEIAAGALVLALCLQLLLRSL
jgi:ABC-type nickel/cobalt efflux system permease component RcnA